MSMAACTWRELFVTARLSLAQAQHNRRKSTRHLLQFAPSETVAV